MIGILFKLLFPLAGVVLLVKWGKAYFTSFLLNNLTAMARAEVNKKKPRDENIIEICARCGNVETRNHRCARN